MEYNLHKMMIQQQSNTNRPPGKPNTQQSKLPVQSQLRYAQVNLFESPLQRPTGGMNSIQKNSTGSQTRGAGGPYQVMGVEQANGMAPSVSRFENNKTRNITQVPSLKSSPLQMGYIMPQLPKEEDFVDEEFNMLTEDGAMQMRQPKNHIQMSERRNAPMNLELFQNLQPIPCQRPQLPLYNQRQLQPSSTNGRSSHQRGSSVFEVKRATAHLTNGLANHQQLQKKALESGELGLEEHVPINPPTLQTSQYGRHHPVETEDEECDQDINEMDEMYVNPNHYQGAETEQDLDGQMDGDEDYNFLIQEQKQQPQQDSPGIQIVHNNHGSSQEGNIPHSSHSSNAKKSPNNYHQSASSLKQKLSQERLGENVGGFLQKSAEKQRVSLIQPRDLQESFKLNPYMINMNKPAASVTNNSSATPNQMKIQSSFSQLANNPLLHKHSSYSSFMKAQSSQQTQHNSMIKRPPSHQKKQNCNETVEDENEVDVVTSPNPVGIGAHQSFNISQANRKKMSEVPANIIPYRPPFLGDFRKPNTASSSILSAPGDTQSLLQSIHYRVVQFNERERERDRSRSNSEQKFGRLMKLESKNMIREEASPTATNFGSTKPKLDLPEVVFTNITGSMDKVPRQASNNKPAKQKDESEKIGDLSTHPPTNFIGPTPTILKSQNSLLSGKLARIPSNTARPSDQQFSDNGEEENLIDPKDMETEKLRVEYLKLLKQFNQLQSNQSVQQYDTKRSLDKRRSEQSALVEQRGHNQPQAPITIEAQKVSTVTSPKDTTQPKSRIARPNSSCMTEKQPRLIPSTIHSEFNFSNGISHQDPVTAQTSAAISIPVKRQFINLETGNTGNEADNLSHSPPTSSQEKLMRKHLHKNVDLGKQAYAKHHSNTTKISRRRQVIQSREKSQASSLSSSSYEDGLTATIQKCIEGSGAAHEQITESDNPTTGDKHLIISTLKSTKGSKLPKSTKQDPPKTSQQLHKRQQYQYNEMDSDDEDIDYSSSSTESHHNQYNTAPKQKQQTTRHKKYSPEDGDDEYESSEKRRMVSKKRAKNKGGESKARKDRKQLKININMNSVTGAPPNNGGQYGKQEPISIMQRNEELIQHIHQQQLLLTQLTAQAYANPQNFILQQQVMQQQHILMSQQLMHPAQYLGLPPAPSHPFSLAHPPLIGLNPGYSQSQIGGNFSDLNSNFGGNPMHTQSMHIPPTSTNPMSHSTDRTNNLFFSTQDDQLSHFHQQLNNPQITQISTSHNNNKYHNYTHLDDTTQVMEGTPSPARRNTVFSNARQVVTSGGTQRGGGAASKGNQSVMNKNTSPQGFENKKLGNGNYTQISRQQSARPSMIAAPAGSVKPQSEYQAMPQKQVHSRNIPISQNYSSPIKNLIAVAVQGDTHRGNQEQEEIKRLTSTYDRTIGDNPQKVDLMRKTMDSLPIKSINHDRQAAALEHRQTGHFGNQPDEKRELFLIQNQDPLNAESSSQGSIEENLPVNSNIKVNNNHYSATHAQLQGSEKKRTQINVVSRSSLTSLEQTRQHTPEQTFKKFGDSPMKLLNHEEASLAAEQDKKEPQAILIGFDDASQVRDPFQNKPQLKPREKVAPTDVKKPNGIPQLSARCKSAKGSSSQASVGSSRMPLGKAEKDGKGNQDSQFTSPQRAGTTAKMISPSKDQNMSQMKRAVIILQKGIDPQTVKVQPQNHMIVEIKPQTNQKRPATTKGAAIGSAKTSITTDHQAFTQAALASQSSQRIPIKDRILSQKKPEGALPPSSKAKPVVLEQETDFNDYTDPKHNKDLPIEIFDGKQRKDPLHDFSEPSLADMFQQKKREVVEKLNQRKLQATNFDSEQDLNLPSEQDSPGRSLKLQAKKEKTKEELFQLRRQMMKSKVKRTQDHFGGSQTEANLTPSRTIESQEQRPQVVKDKVNLMSRLAQGKKTHIDKKEMKRLTSKNYNNLPEVVKKREEEAKKQEIQARKAAAQEYMKQFEQDRKKKAAAAAALGRKKVQ